MNFKASRESSLFPVKTALKTMSFMMLRDLPLAAFSLASRLIALDNQGLENGIFIPYIGNQDAWRFSKNENIFKFEVKK
jgi:hypothetical protein